MTAPTSHRTPILGVNQKREDVAAGTAANFLPSDKMVNGFSRQVAFFQLDISSRPFPLCSPCRLRENVIHVQAKASDTTR